MFILSSVLHHQFEQRKEKYRAMREDVFLSMRILLLPFLFVEYLMKRR